MSKNNMTKRIESMSDLLRKEKCTYIIIAQVADNHCMSDYSGNKDILQKMLVQLFKDQPDLVEVISNAATEAVDSKPTVITYENL